MKRYQAVPFTDTKYRLAESPFWDERTKTLSFVDIPAGRFYRIMSDGEIRMFEEGRPVGAAVPAVKPGAYVLAAADGIDYFENEAVRRIADLSSLYKPWQRSNDAKADPAGRLYFGSTSDDERAGFGGNLYCLDSGIRIVQPDTKISNGMAWNRARTKFFFSDSTEHAVFSYEYDAATGDISGRTVLFPITDGVPDGMCIDADDNLWVAVWGGFRIEQRSSVSGELLAVVEVPADHVSSCCFVGEHTLLITSSGDGLTGPHDGKLFTCRVEAAPGETCYCTAEPAD